MLKTVAFTWTQQDVSDEARTLFHLGTELYERVGVLAGHANDLRRAIEKTVDSYNRFAGSLESRVLVTARKFPGIDETKLASVAAPPALDAAPRRWTAPEMLDLGTTTGDDDSAGDASPSRVPPVDASPADTGASSAYADLGGVRARAGLLDEPGNRSEP